MKNDADICGVTLRAHECPGWLTGTSKLKFSLRRALPGLVAAIVCATLVAWSGQAARADDFDSDQNHWVAAWQGSPTPGGTFFSPGCPSDVGLNSQTVRNIIYPTMGGSWVRARISNAAEARPLA